MRKKKTKKKSEDDHTEEFWLLLRSTVRFSPPGSRGKRKNQTNKNLKAHFKILFGVGICYLENKQG